MDDKVSEGLGWGGSCLVGAQNASLSARHASDGEARQARLDAAGPSAAGGPGQGNSWRGPLPAPDAGQQVDLAVRRNGFEPAVLVDLAVDRDRNALFELGPHRREAFTEDAQELADIRRLDVDFLGAPGELFQIAGEKDAGHGSIRRRL